MTLVSTASLYELDHGRGGGHFRPSSKARAQLRSAATDQLPKAWG